MTKQFKPNKSPKMSKEERANKMFKMALDEIGAGGVVTGRQLREFSQEAPYEEDPTKKTSDGGSVHRSMDTAVEGGYFTPIPGYVYPNDRYIVNPWQRPNRENYKVPRKVKNEEAAKLSTW